MEHIEEAGVHSGDSACSLPPYSLPRDVIEEIVESTRRMALALGVRGLMNVQYAVKGKEVYVLEVNPRASRTVPFVSKAIGVPLAKLAALVMAGRTLEELGFTAEIWPEHFSVKEAVFPFMKFPGVDTVLGPEMKSTGEVMGIDSDFGRAYAKAQIEAGNPIPAGGTRARLAPRRGPRAARRRDPHDRRRRLPAPGDGGHGGGPAQPGLRGRDGAEGRGRARPTSSSASSRATSTSSSTRCRRTRARRATRSRCAAPR